MSSEIYRKELLGLLIKVVSVLESRRPYAAGHSKRVAALARTTAEHMGLAPQECEDIFFTGLFHDIGYLVLPDDILESTAELTPQMREVLNSHLQVGIQILSSSSQLKVVCDLLRFHQHRFDGRDAPDGTAGADIPLGTRIVQVAEAFDALTSPRPHRKRLPLADAMEALEKDKGRFDPEVIREFFMALRKDMPTGKQPQHELKKFGKKIDDIIARVSDGRLSAPTVPKVAFLIEKMMGDDDSSLGQISKVIEMEPSLALKVMATANSSLFYGMSPVYNLPAALVRLGLLAAKNLVVTHIYKSIFDLPIIILRNTLQDWWEQSLLTAAACQSLAPRLNIPNDGGPYLLGLLHNIGKPCLLQAIVSAFKEKKFSEQQIEIIFDRIDQHHTSVGLVVLEEAKFSVQFIRAMTQDWTEDSGQASPEELLLSSAKKVVHLVLADADSGDGGQSQGLGSGQFYFSRDEMEAAMGATVHRYQALQSFLAAAD